MITAYISQKYENQNLSSNAKLEMSMFFKETLYNINKSKGFVIKFKSLRLNDVSFKILQSWSYFWNTYENPPTNRFI